MFLRTNRMLLRGKFDISPYKSKASAWKIRCFSVQIESLPVQNSMLLHTKIESDRKLLRGKLHRELGDLGSPGQQIAEIMFWGREVVLSTSYLGSFFGEGKTLVGAGHVTLTKLIA